MDYSKTIHLPKSLLPMKADLPLREPEMLDFWEKNQIYKQMLLKRKGCKKFVLHDGPPYANGHIHMGHALNKILKDMIVKFKAMNGFFSPYIPGWDCHGLPIEHQLMKELKKDKHSIDRLEFRKKAAEFAKQFVQIQKKEFKRLGILGDWKNPYLTLTPNYETVILKIFRELLLRGYIERGKKPVLWCPKCETALAEAEVEYEEKESPSVYVKFKLMQPIGGGINPNNQFVVIWTTTPWTLPANLGVMFGYALEYSLVLLKKSKEKEEWIIAKNLVTKILEEKLKLQKNDYAIQKVYSGKELASAIAYERIFPKTGNEEFGDGMCSDQVSEEEGTGIIHIAPGHGEIDYLIGHIENELPVLSPVDDSGKFSNEVDYPELKGLFVLGKGNEKILEILDQQKKILVHQEKIRHSYPHCWRCKKPVIFRATPQWFLKIEKKIEGDYLRVRLLQEIDKVLWIPEYGKNRIGGMIEQRPDWCLSRQRFWGTPIPIFYCKKCQEPLTDDQAVGMVEEIVGLEGSDIWFKEKPEYFLKNLKNFKCHQCGGEEFVQENDILDVWFDSGVSHEAVLKGDAPTITGDLWKDVLNWPADLYLEGSDQHRGWFQTSLIPAVALHDKAPYKSVLTHGFIVDGEGKKMSKSLGNVIAPEDILKTYGADILRLWVAASDYREDIRLSQDILKGVAENYRKIRNTFRYLIGNLSDFDYSKNRLPYEKMLAIDRWALTRLSQVIQNCQKAYDSFEFHLVVVRLIEFCTTDCSSFYFDLLKDRLYTFREDSPERLSGQTVLYHILSSLLRLFAPILSFTCEEVWQIGFQNGHWQEASVFLKDFPEILPEWDDKKLHEKLAQILQIREKANLSLEAARRAGQIGSSLEARLIFSGGADTEKNILKSLQKDLAMIFIVSQVEMRELSGALEIAVEKAAGNKCVRCWRYDETVNKNGSHPGLCLRCVEMIQ